MSRFRGIRLAWTLCVCWAWTAPAGEIGVRVENPPATGAVVALLYDSADAFADLRDPAGRVVWEAADPGAGFAGLAAGRYAVLVFHDENGNGELDVNFLGIPREPLGFSRRYWGKGEPVFADAAVELGERETLPVEVELREIFGRRGLFGVGVGVIAQSSPYRETDSGQVLAIPAITYIGERVQILGPVAQAGLVNWERARLAATARYRLGAYDEEDSEYLEGMGDRKDSLFAGVAVQGQLPAGLRVSGGYEHDVLDRVGGGEGRLEIRRGFQIGRVSVAPGIGATWLTAELARHEYGVKEGEARVDRAAYRPGDAVNLDLGLGLTLAWGESWRVILDGRVEWLAGELRDSPLVDKGEVLHLFGAVNYTF